MSHMTDRWIVERRVAFHWMSPLQLRFVSGLPYNEGYATYPCPRRPKEPSMKIALILIAAIVVLGIILAVAFLFVFG